MAGARTGVQSAQHWWRPRSISTGTLLLATFELSMADWPSGFVLLGILPLTALLFFGCCVWTRDAPAARPARRGVKFAVPFLICAATLALLQYAPLHKVALQQNFKWHRADRERIVARVEAGELKPNVSYNEILIALGDKEPNVSAGGNDIVVDQAKDGTYVLFLTSRSLKHYFSRLPARAAGRRSQKLLRIRRQGAEPARALRQGLVFRGELGPLLVDWPFPTQGR